MTESRTGEETSLFYSETLYKYTLRDWLKKLASLFHPIRCETETKILLAHTRFPALGVSDMNLLQVLIGSLDCLCPLLLAKVITLVFDTQLKTALFCNQQQ